MAAPIEQEGLLTEHEAAEWRAVFANLIADGMSVAFACAKADDAIRVSRRAARHRRSSTPPAITGIERR